MSFVQIPMTAKQVAEYFVVFVADVAEQMTNVMSYIDVYHQEDPARLWPGSGQPGIGLSFYSRMLKTAAPLLDATPPVFNSCTETIKIEVGHLHFSFHSGSPLVPLVSADSQPWLGRGPGSRLLLESDALC